MNILDGLMKPKYLLLIQESKFSIFYSITNIYMSTCNKCRNCFKKINYEDNILEQTNYYKLTLFTNYKLRPLSITYPGLIPDIFRKCFTDCIVEECNEFCSFVTNKTSEFDYYLGNSVLSPFILRDELILIMFHIGISAPNFFNIEKFNNTSFQYINNDIAKFNKFIFSNTGTTEYNMEFLDNHQLKFLNYFKIKYKPETLLYQYINFIWLLQKNYDNYIEGKVLLNFIYLPWEYSLSCNNKYQNNIKKKLYRFDLIQIYIDFKQALANNSLDSFNKDFLKIMKLAMIAYRDILVEYIQTANYQSMPLYNKNFNKCYYCPSKYLNPYFEPTIREDALKKYEIYMTNKTKIYTNKFRQRFNIDDYQLNKNLDTFLINIFFIKVIFNENINNKKEFFKDNYKDLDYEIIDEEKFNLDKFYFLENNEKFIKDLSQFDNIICWNKIDTDFINIKDILKDFNFDNTINISINENYTINIFYI